MASSDRKAATDQVVLLDLDGAGPPDAVLFATLMGRPVAPVATAQDLSSDIAAILIQGTLASAARDRAGHAALAQVIGEHAQSGTPILGMGAGFAWLCDQHHLPGSLTTEGTRTHAGTDVHVRVEGRPTPFTGAIPAARILAVPCPPHPVRYVGTDLPGLEQDARIVLRFVDASGAVTEGANPHGSHANIAGICNDAGNVVGMLVPVAGEVHQILQSLDLWLVGPGQRQPGARQGNR